MKIGNLLFAMIVILLLSGLANTVIADENTGYLIQNSNYGTEFWFSIPPALLETNDNEILIQVVSTEESNVEIKIDGKGYYSTLSLGVFDSKTIKLTPAQAHPVIKSNADAPLPEMVYKNSGIQVISDNPVSVFVGVNYSSVADGFLAIPKSSLGTEYIVSGYNEDPGFSEQFNMNLPGICCITATEDDTEVSFTLAGNDETETAGGLTPGKVVSNTLEKGDVWVFMSEGYAGDLSGSRILSNKPVSVVAANQCADIPVGNKWCDYIIEMTFPVFSFGKEYIVPVIPGRLNPGIARVYASEDNTIININGQPKLHLSESGGKCGAGYAEIRLPDDKIISDYQPTYISSDKPIGVNFYNQGTQEEDHSLNSGPFTFPVIPIEQFRKKILFNIPDIAGSYIPVENQLIIVFKCDSNYMMLPDDISLGRVENDEIIWESMHLDYTNPTPVKVGEDYYGQYVTVVYPGVDQFCGVKADRPLAAYIFGAKENTYGVRAYGYPGGALFNDLDPKDTLPPVPEYTQDEYGDIINAIVRDYPLDPELRSNLAKLILYRDSTFNCTFSYDEFIPGVDSETEWNLTVINKEKNARALIGFVDRAGNDTLIDIYYQGVYLSLSSNTVNFGNVDPRYDNEKELTLKNISAKEITINNIELETNDGHFTLQDFGTEFTLQPDEEYAETIAFTSDMHGSFNNNVIITYEDSRQITASVVAVVRDIVPPLSYNSNPMDLGENKINESKEDTLVITNLDYFPVTIDSLRLDNEDGLFTLPEPMDGKILASDESADCKISYTSADEGIFNNRLIVYYNQSGRDTVDLVAKSKKPSAVLPGMEFALEEVRPNPVGAAGATIDYSIGSYSDVKIELFSLDGTIVSTLVSNLQQPGNYSVRLPIEKLNSGMYICRMSSGSFEKTINIRVVK